MLSRIVVIRDKAGRGGGSGFVVRVFERTWVASNAHVFAGSEKMEIVTNDDTVLPWRRALIGKREDVVLFEVETSLEPFSLAQSVETSVRIGAKVIAYGNSHAEDAITALPGEVLGIGPARLEVSAPFVRGNSGGPIILEGSGWVVGIASYFTYPPTGEPGTEGTRFQTAVRRFAVRLDCLAREDFQEVEPDLFRTELRQVLAARKRNAGAEMLVQDLAEKLEAAGKTLMRDDTQSGIRALALVEARYPDSKFRDLVRLWNRTVEASPDRRGKSRLRGDVEYRLRQFRAHLEAPFKGDPEKEFRHQFLREGPDQMGDQRKTSSALLGAFDEVSKRILAVLDRPEPEPWPPAAPRLPSRYR